MNNTTLFLILFCSCFILRLLTAFWIYSRCSKNGLNPPFPLTQFNTIEFNNYIKEKSQIEEFSWLKRWILLLNILFVLLGGFFLLLVLSVVV